MLVCFFFCNVYPQEEPRNSCAIELATLVPYRRLRVNDLITDSSSLTFHNREIAALSSSLYSCIYGLQGALFFFFFWGCSSLAPLDTRIPWGRDCWLFQPPLRTFSAMGMGRIGPVRPLSLESFSTSPSPGILNHWFYEPWVYYGFF